MTKKVIVAVKKEEGNIKEVKFQDGEVVSIETAIQMAKQDLIENVNVGSTRGVNPHRTLRSNPDGDSSNNLDNLPQF